MVSLTEEDLQELQRIVLQQKIDELFEERKQKLTVNN